MDASRIRGRAALALAVAAWALTAVWGRSAPPELCYADPRGKDRVPMPPLGTVPGVTLEDLRSKGAPDAHAEAWGCELSLIDVPVNMSEALDPTPGPVDVSVGWFYDAGECGAIPLAFRTFFGCRSLPPTVDACEGHSQTRLLSLYDVTVTLYGSSLLLRPGLYDAGVYLYMFGGAGGWRYGSVNLTVRGEGHRPCSPDYGVSMLTSPDPQPGHAKGIVFEEWTAPPHRSTSRPPHTSPAPADSGPSCYPPFVDLAARWGGISADATGSPPDWVPGDYDDEDDDEEALSSEEGSASGEESGPEECRAQDLLAETRTFRNATGPEELLIGALGASFLTTPLNLKGGEYPNPAPTAAEMPRALPQRADAPGAPSHRGAANAGELGAVLSILVSHEATIYLCTIALLLLGLICLAVYACVMRSRVAFWQAHGYRSLYLDNSALVKHPDV
ncbi:envelope glycoprotein G [Beluga whale alphaherpesvirus 1]|uniref:Envelope glycoprotein G n=1 Tax=Beluga whale alphaherpesvirus 1 TaxID=1434720 RepID=A0A286MM84_9ALPH|nr:envelope glycoprotein G [Beluga whale alphaherpesvirus 1]ASW27110.1 envelope glycoprotein G [Beluga whale alphaherpesvirus 1]